MSLCILFSVCVKIIKYGKWKGYINVWEPENATQSVCGILDLKKIGPAKKLVKKIWIFLNENSGDLCDFIEFTTI